LIHRTANDCGTSLLTTETNGGLPGCAFGSKTRGDMIDLTPFAGLPVRMDPSALTLAFGESVTTASPQVRRLDEVRSLLRDPLSEGPEHLYTIYMDIRVPGVADDLRANGLGYGAVVYNHGALGGEALRSQGHVHSAAPQTGVAYSELYEFWHGRGLVYMQDAASPEVGEVVVVEAGPGDKVAIPPGWAHATVNVGREPMAFGAVYALDAVLLYEPLRRLQGTAHYVLADGTLEPNPRYARVPAARRAAPHEIPECGVARGRPALAGDVSRLDFVTRPERYPALWARLAGR
jgi:glucose-6-phosphate isomerase